MGLELPSPPSSPRTEPQIPLRMFLGCFKVIENTRVWRSCSVKAPAIQEGKPGLCSFTGRRKRTKFQFPGRKTIQKNYYLSKNYPKNPTHLEESSSPTGSPWGRFALVSSWKISRIWERLPGTGTPKQHFSLPQPPWLKSRSPKSQGFPSFEVSWG